MLVEGRWHLFRDGTLRPVIDSAVQVSGGGWQQVMLLLDSGADRTVLDATFLELFESQTLPESDISQMGGIGGKVDCIFVETQLGLVRDDGMQVRIQGSFGIFTDIASSDVSVLGRDVTNNFDVIYSYPTRRVTMLASPHIFRIDYAS